MDVTRVHLAVLQIACKGRGTNTFGVFLLGYTLEYQTT